MGPSARAALPAVVEAIAEPGRRDFGTADPDERARLDEALLDQLHRTRSALTGRERPLWGV